MDLQRLTGIDVVPRPLEMRPAIKILSQMKLRSSFCIYKKFGIRNRAQMWYPY